ncbi:MAG: hypothetical protein L3J13_03275 [Devosiaceae bacterium]|nr:hypothetical protein [Devosiaceae bacterium]
MHLFAIALHALRHRHGALDPGFHRGDAVMDGVAILPSFSLPPSFVTKT